MKAVQKILMLIAFISMASFGYSQNKNDVQTKSTQEYEQEIAKLKKQVSNLNSQISDLNQQLNYKNREIQRKQNEVSKIKTEPNTLQQEKTKLVDENTKLQKQLDAVSQYYPIIIKSLKVGNTYYDNNIETEYGDTLRSSSSMYLTPQIEYIGLKNTPITLYLKLYQNGQISTSSDSPSGYTYKSNITISAAERKIVVGGWGSKTIGHWTVGNYRYEIWYEGTCLKAVDFTLY
jgi:myosin heavy subunit